MRPLWGTLLAGALYGFIAVAWTYPLVLRPSELTAISYDHSEDAEPQSNAGLGPIVRNDQLLSIAVPSRNAHNLLAGRLHALLDNGLCYPLDDAAALGEHMIEFSLLTLPTYALSGNPLLSFNVACLLEVMLMGMTCFALLRYWTRENAASFVATALLVFHPWRLDLFTHPALVSLHWLPLVLLCFERLLRSPSPKTAALLCLTAVLQLLTASYLAITFAIFAGVYGTARLAGEREHVRGRTLAFLAVSIVGAGLALAPILIPYATAQSTWSLSRLGEPLTTSVEGLLPGGPHSVGALVLLLAGLVPVFRKRSRAEPVVAIFAASVACFALGARVPGIDTVLGNDSLYELLRDRVAILSMIRVPAVVRVGGYFGLSLLAGIGLARLLRGLRPSARNGVIAVVTAIAALELFYPPATVAIYRSYPRVAMRELGPSTEVLEGYAALDEIAPGSPILDLPFEYTRIVRGRMAQYVYWSAYHLHNTAACYNSFFGPVYENVGRIAERYWAGASAEELLALELRSLAIHDPELWIGALGSRADSPVAAARTSDLIAARLDGTVRTHDDVTRLRPGPLEVRRAPMPPNRLQLALQVTNTAKDVWRLPMPPRPVAANTTWVSTAAPTEAIALRGTVLLPLALAAGRTDTIPIAMTQIPAPGQYQLTMTVPDVGWVIHETVAVPAIAGARR